MDEWNKDHPSFALTPQKKQGKFDGEDSMSGDDAEQEKGGDGLLQRLNRYRGLTLPNAPTPPTRRRACSRKLRSCGARTCTPHSSWI